MDKDTNTFIPHDSGKRPAKARFTSVFLVMAIGAFIVSVVIGAMSYLARVSLSSQLTSYKEGLERSRVRFDTGLPIRSIEEFDKRLRSVRDILAKHKSFAGFFSLIERITLTNVQITSLTYSEIENTKKNSVRIIARAPDYKTIAEMNEQFSVDPEARRYITDVVFSNLSVDPKQEDLINFEINFNVDSEFLLYSRYVNPPLVETGDTGSVPDASAPRIRNQ